MRKAILALFFSVIGLDAFAGDAASADAYYQSENWPDAARAYAEIVSEQPANGRAWYRLAVANRYMGRYESAMKNLNSAEQNGVPASVVQYELAKVYGSTNETGKALGALRAAAHAGFADTSGLDGEALAALRTEPEFQEISNIIKRNAAPCDYDAHHREFDFWLGEWNVADIDGIAQGTNTIRKAENGCLLVENWTSGSGSTGQSMNYFDPHTGKWYQRWVSPGVLINLAGNFEEGAMRLAGDIYYFANRTFAKFKGTWTPLEDGRVRQYFEQSQDNGETWQPWFDGYYQRKQETIDAHQ